MFRLTATMLLLTSTLLAADLPCSVQQSRTSCWANERLSEFAEHITLSNGHNVYELDYLQWAPDVRHAQAAKIECWLYGPRIYGGFSRPLRDFLRLHVNGIANSRLYPRADDIKLWQENGEAGCRITMRFDGVVMIANWFMRPDSPVLWCHLQRSDTSIEPLRKATLSIAAAPSGYIKDQNDKVVWSGIYEPQTITPARTITVSSEPVLLTPADAYLIFQDTRHDDATGGPCYLTLDYTATTAVRLFMPNQPNRRVEIELKPEMHEFRFGLWQQKNRLSNSDFLQQFRAAEQNYRFK